MTLESDLVHAYVTLGLSQNAAAARCGVGRHRARELLRAAGVTMRRTGPPLTRPTREQLLAWKAEGLRIREIAQVRGVTPQAAGHWYKVEQIAPPHAWDWRGYPSGDALRTAYESGQTLEEMAEELGVSTQVIVDLCNHHRIGRRAAGWGDAGRRGRDGHRVKSRYELLVCDWLTDHALPHEYEPSAPGRYTPDFRVGEVYIEVWGVEGNAEYDARKILKRQWYANQGMTLVEMPKWCFPASRVKGRWDRRLELRLLSRHD